MSQRSLDVITIFDLCSITRDLQKLSKTLTGFVQSDNYLLFTI